MIAKVVYRLTDGKVAFWVSSNKIDMVAPQYDAGANGCSICDIPDDMAADYSRYFYVAGDVSKDYYGKLSLTCDKTSMPADGTSIATYTVSKLDSAGNPMTLPADNDVVTVATTRGTLSTTTVTLANGVGTFTLRSVPETISIDVSVSSGNLGPASSSITLTA